MKEVAQKLTPFIPQNLRLDIFASLWEEYRNAEELARELGCKPALVHKWLKEGKAPNNNYMPRILSLALQRSQGVREMLRGEVLESIGSLFGELGIFPQKRAPGDLGEILWFLDEKSRQILWYLWWNRHAEIGELTRLVEAESDMEILSRIKQVINPAAQDVLGKEIVRFENSKIDPVTDERVLFSWWLEEGLLRGKRREPLVDIFEENNHIAIIAQLPATLGLTKEAQVEYRNGILRIKIERVRKSGLTIKEREQNGNKKVS
jgi:hypothetical protein